MEEKDYEHLIGKEVMDSDGVVSPVIAIDRSIGITLDNGQCQVCINGPLSPHRTDPNYDEAFEYLVDAIEFGYIDIGILADVMNNKVSHLYGSFVGCAFSA